MSTEKSDADSGIEADAAQPSDVEQDDVATVVVPTVGLDAAKPSVPDQTAKPSQSDQTAKPSQSDQTAKPSKADKLVARAERLREQEARRATERAAAPTASGSRTGWIVAVSVLSAVSVLLVVALVVSLLALKDKRDDLDRSRQVDSARTASLSAAKSWAVEFGSYDYQHLDEDFRATAALMTTKFAASYTRTSKALAQTFVAYKTQVTATVPQAAIISATPTAASVLVLLDQVIKSTQSTTPKINRNRLKVTLVRSKGKWLIDRTDAV